MINKEGVAMADSIVIQNNYSYALDIDKIDCDYYAYLKTESRNFTVNI